MLVEELTKAVMPADLHRYPTSDSQVPTAGQLGDAGLDPQATGARVSSSGGQRVAMSAVHRRRETIRLARTKA